MRTSFPQLSVNYFYDRYVTSIRGTVGRACTIRNSSVRKFLQTFCESHSPIPKSRERSKLNETKDSLSFRNSRSPKLKRVKRVEESSKGMWALFGDERDRERERERERENEKKKGNAKESRLFYGRIHGRATTAGPGEFSRALCRSKYVITIH